jgi:hypothetical protein
VTEPPERPQHLDLRASDADRERVAKILHDAMSEGRLTLSELDDRLQVVYAAKTLGELEPVTADLPGVQPIVPIGPSQAGAVAPSDRIGGTATGGPLIAVLSGCDRKGDWVLAEQQTAVAVLGGVELDLREARFAARECTINVFALLGGVEITVPEDVTVHISGVGILGGFDHGGSGEGDPNGPVLRVTGVAILGGVEVKRRSGKRLRSRRRDELES